MALSKIQNNSYTDTAVHGQRNLIINGGCVIDQRNNGAAITSSGYVVDRFHYQNDSDATLSLQQSSTVPDNFANSISVTVSTADASVGTTQYSMITQRIEGYNIANLGWGTSAAKAVTLSFYVRSSVTGTFGGVLNNSDSSRSYPFTYSISSADTWEKKTITIEGDTSGTWNTTNSSGIQLRWAFGMGSTYVGTAGSWSGNLYFGASGAVNLISTLNATFYITGVQLEAGDVATPFEHRSFGDELARCQRYYEKTYPYATTPGTASSYNTITALGIAGMDEETSGQRYITYPWRVEKRTAPTLTIYDQAGNSGKVTTLDNAGTQTHNVGVGLAFAGTYVMGAGPANSAIWGLTFFCVGDSEL